MHGAKNVKTLRLLFTAWAQTNFGAHIRKSKTF